MQPICVGKRRYGLRMTHCKGERGHHKGMELGGPSRHGSVRSVHAESIDLS